jgi:hypothetical protein
VETSARRALWSFAARWTVGDELEVRLDAPGHVGWVASPPTVASPASGTAIVGNHSTSPRGTHVLIGQAADGLLIDEKLASGLGDFPHDTSSMFVEFPIPPSMFHIELRQETVMDKWFVWQFHDAASPNRHCTGTYRIAE